MAGELRLWSLGNLVCLAIVSSAVVKKGKLKARATMNFMMIVLVGQTEADIIDIC